MERFVADVENEVLVDIVKLAQKQGLEGAQGGWKAFLKSCDKKIGASVCDPAKRSRDILIAFLNTFTKEDDLKFFDIMIRRHTGRKKIEKFFKDFPDRESPEQRLVHLTMEHPHYTQHYSFPSHDEDWVVAPLGNISKVMKSKTLISVDCEMVLCKDGSEAVVKVCAVDRDLEVKLDELVNPNKIVIDYRTHITGVSAKDLEGVTCTLVDIQKSFKKLLSDGTILVGHSLHNDLRVLKIDHPQVIDTSYIFKARDLPADHAPSLNNLCKVVLGYEVRKEGEAHNCLNDAQSTMKLVLAKLEHRFNDPIDLANKERGFNDHIDLASKERGFNDPIDTESKIVPNSDLAKLFIHNVKVGVSFDELRKLFSSDCNVEIQTDLRIRGKTYSTFAFFKDATEANESFRRIEGQESKDKSGLLQKLVKLKLSSGETTTLYVRTMAPETTLEGKEGKDPKKNLPEYEAPDSKRPRLSLNKCDHAEEIDRLRQEIRYRDEEKVHLQKVISLREEEIKSLQKIVSAITRKHGL